MELFHMLKEGSIDFVGQKQSYDFQFYVIWTAGIVGWLHGFVVSSFKITFYWIFGATVLCTILCLPSWPIWNKNPVEWLEPEEEEEEEKPEPKKAKGGNAAKAEEKKAEGSSKKSKGGKSK